MEPIIPGASTVVWKNDARTQPMEWIPPNCSVRQGLVGPLPIEFANNCCKHLERRAP